MKRRKFQPSGVCAVRAEAYGTFFELEDEPSGVEMRDGVAIVKICGPLMHHADFWFDSYDGIVSRITAAIEQSPRAIVMQIDSPGGLVSGCFEAARKIKADCAEAGVPLYALAEGCCASAAYALACSAEHIVAPEVSLLGSIGVVDALVDATAMDAQFGLKWRIITSGVRKADGNPHQPTSDGAVLATQGRVMEIAAIFFNHVAEARGMTADVVQGLEAAVFIGASAVKAGLADEIGTLDTLLAAITSGNVQQTETETPQESDMGTKAEKGDEDKMSKLRKMAEDGDKEAQRILKALDAEGDDEDAPTPDEESSAEDDAPPPKDDDEEEASASASTPVVISTGTANDLASAFARLEALEKTNENERRATLLASRPDVSPGLRKLLATKPYAEVKAMLDAIPKKIVKPAALATVAGTRGNTEGTESRRLPKGDKAKLDRAMGLVTTEPVVKHEGVKLVLGAYEPKSA